MPTVPTAATLSSLSQPALLAPWGVLHNQLIEGKKNLRLGSQMVLHDMQVTPERVSYGTAPFCDIPEGN